MNISSFSHHSSLLSDIQPNKPVKTFQVLPDKCFDKHIACTWRRGNKFAIYPTSQNPNKTVSDSAQKTEDKIINIRQEVILFTPILRKLVNEANGTFLSLQKVAETSKSTDNQVDFLKLSRQYRSIIRVCIESLQEAAEKENDGIEKNTYLSYITIFYSIECIWHLCEILYIDIIPGEVVLPFLLEWVRFHFPCYEQTAAHLLEACEIGSEDHKDYWDTVIGMVVQGRVDVVRALLKLHSASDTNQFKLLDNSLRSMPVYNVYGGISTGEFIISWKHWQAECRSKLSSRVLREPQLELIMRLMTGDRAAFESVSSKFSSWFDMLGGWVLFTTPCARRRELGAAGAACGGAGGAGGRSHLDHVLRALLDGDLHQVIYEIQQISDNGWFATHLTDILYHCGKLQILDKHQNDVTGRLRDSLVQEYGALLLEHRSLWVAGASYAAAGAGALLERVTLQSEAKAMRVAAEARRHGLVDVVRTIGACMSTRLLSGGTARTGGALAWGARARSGAACARAAHGALRAHAAGAPLPAPDLLLTAGPALLVDDTLLLLGKYCDFHRLYKSRDFRKAAKLLVSLIASNISPEYFWPTLLLDTLPLLETEEPVLSAQNTYDIMLCLELRSGCLSKEKADLLRLALSRNLARTVLTDIEDQNA